MGKLVPNQDADKLKISIVIPAYNAALRLPIALDSILDQTFPRKAMEVIVVDDGSDDATRFLLEKYSSIDAELFRFIQLGVPSGSPAKPRNIGLREAKGEYVFFLDADDWLAPQAVEKMLAHADEWGSDVLLVKLIGEGGRDVPRSMFFANQPSVDIFNSNVMWTFGPMKLFRRILLVDNGIVFPDYMPEDITFTLKAYLAAKVVSVAADYDYYHYLLYDADKQCSFSTWNDLDSNYRAMSELLLLASEEANNGHNVSVLIKRLFSRDICRMLVSSCIQDDENAFSRICHLARPYYLAGIACSMAIPERVILDVSFRYGFSSAKRFACAYPAGIVSLGSLVFTEGSACWRLRNGDEDLDIPMNETGGFSAAVLSVEIQLREQSFTMQGILTAPSYALRGNLSLVLVAEEVRGTPRFEFQCWKQETESIPDELIQGRTGLAWSSSVDVKELKKCFPFPLPVKKRDLAGRKRWAFFLELRDGGNIVKKARVNVCSSTKFHSRGFESPVSVVKGGVPDCITLTSFGGLLLETKR